MELTGASQKIASIVATASQAQFQSRTVTPVTLVRNLHTNQPLMVAKSSSGETGQVTLIQQQMAGQHVQIIQPQMFSQQVILQKPLDQQSGGNGWHSQEKPALHVLVCTSLLLTGIIMVLMHGLNCSQSITFI